jgi:HD-like signal output (HDOD) protein
MSLFTSSPPAAGVGKTLSPELQKALGKITDIASLPEVTTRIVEVVENPRASAKDIHDIVQTDPALATKVLKIVNSAFYGLPSKVASLDRAILMLGLSAVKNLALAASLARFLDDRQICEQFNTRDLWRHCVAVGVCARGLAMVGRQGQPDEAFVAGLVHDMGLLVLQQIYPAKVREVAEACLKQPQDYCAAEWAALGADHQTFGGALALKWKFPPGLRNAIAYHHDPQALQSEYQLAATLVCLADIVCAQAQLGYYLTAQHQRIEDWMLAITQLTPPAVQQFAADMPQRLAEAEQIFTF